VTAANGPTKVREIAGVAPDAIPYAELIAAQQPAILRGVAREWPLVQAGLDGPPSAMAYLKAFWSGKPVVGYVARPECNGRFFYDATLTTLDFDAKRVGFDAFLDRIADHLEDPRAPAFYIGSTDLETYLPGLGAENGLGLDPLICGATPPLVSIWIGNHTLAAAHFDMSNNIACSLVGRRRFTLFPPEQIENLYPGPLEPTPGGQVVSLVDFREPDFDLFPRARDALAAAQVAELEPGDLLFYPALWWHQVEALEPFNVMINYWWNPAPAFMDTPWNTLLHGILSLRDRPPSEKAAWRALFDYYLFEPADRAGAHLPEPARGNLGPLDAVKARRLRAFLLNRLNR
jgi:hypothetical protein